MAGRTNRSSQKHRVWSGCVDHCFDYFEKLGYQNAAEHDIKLESGDAPLLVKYLWDNLTDAPHGIVKISRTFLLIVQLEDQEYYHAIMRGNCLWRC